MDEHRADLVSLYADSFREDLLALLEVHAPDLDKDAAASFICLNIARQPWPFMSYPRNDMRAAWEDDFEGRLRELGLMDSMFSHRYMDGGRNEPKHPSKLIAELVGGMTLHYKVYEVFLVEYFMKKFDPSKLELSDQTLRLYRRINQENPGRETGGQDKKAS